jgi:hypothetical protein
MISRSPESMHVLRKLVCTVVSSIVSSYAFQRLQYIPKVYSVQKKHMLDRPRLLTSTIH